MKNKIINLIIAIVALISGALFISSTPTYADSTFTIDCNASDADVPPAIKKAAGCDTKTDAKSVVTNILSAIIGMLGLVAVIFIVIGGIQYMNSSGDTTKLKKAKDTILYACIGLAVAALAFAITQFAIDTINSSDCPAGETWDESIQSCV